MVCFLLFVILFGVLGWPQPCPAPAGGSEALAQAEHALGCCMRAACVRCRCGSQQPRGAGCRERVPEGLGELWRWLDVAQEGAGPREMARAVSGERRWAPWLLCDV